MKSERIPITLYETLEVSPRASAPVIKAAYRCLVQLHHPDKNPGDPGAADRLAHINQAYAVLSDLQQRQDYDTRLSLTAVTQTARAERRGTGTTATSVCSTVATRPVSRSFAFRPLQ
jgi:curved DNA-binding protein CbpA